MNVLDMRYGRRGGRVVEFDDSTAPLCATCGEPMRGGQWPRHHLCQRDSLVGLHCTCPPGCTDTHWGNGDRACDPTCLPCQRMAGQPYVGRKKKDPDLDDEDELVIEDIEPDMQASLFGDIA